jgi:hypothetical protein
LKRVIPVPLVFKPLTVHVSGMRLNAAQGTLTV